MSTINLHDTPFRGVSRSYTRTPGSVGGVICCAKCGSSLANRKEQTRWATIARARFEVHVYLCRCGKRREIRRAA
jgi:hypothetical protein